jgi:hypothetical protein
LPTSDAGGPYSNITYASLPTSQVLSGSGTPGTGGTTIVGYAWTLIDVPTGSAAALSSGTAQNPTINGIDLPGTYIAKLVVTDDAGGVSESATIDVPDAGFAYVCALTEHAALEIPGYSERNWKDKLTGWADSLDAAVGDFAPATTSTQGTVQLSESPVSAGAPVAVTQDRVYMTLRATGKIAATSMAGNPAQSLLQFVIPETLNAVQWSYLFADGGTTTRTPAYTIDLYHQSSAEFVANTFNVGDLLSTFTVAAPGTNNIPMNGASSTFDRAMVARDVLSVVVSAADADAADQGSDLQITIVCKRKW